MSELPTIWKSRTHSLLNSKPTDYIHTYSVTLLAVGPTIG